MKKNGSGNTYPILHTTSGVRIPTQKVLDVKDSLYLKTVLIPARILYGEKRPGSRYISFPVKAMIENDYSGLEAPKIVGEVQRHTTTGYLITRHLLNCKIDGENVEYLQAYLEITGAWDDSFTEKN